MRKALKVEFKEESSEVKGEFVDDDVAKAGRRRKRRCGEDIQKELDSLGVCKETRHTSMELESEAGPSERRNSAEDCHRAEVGDVKDADQCPHPCGLENGGADDDNIVYVSETPWLGPSQLGVFAARALSPGQVVAEMESPTRLSLSKARELMIAHDLPADAFPQVVHTRPCVRFDQAMLTRVPTWYRLNHSWKPNLRAEPHGDTLLWVCTRDVRAGEELTWFYGQPDPAWNKRA